MSPFASPDATDGHDAPPAHESDEQVEARYLADTTLLDLAHPAIEALVERHRWRELEVRDRIGAIYDFVRNDIAFGYNADDNLSAPAVLADGYGQCNTKSTLLMALLRASGVPCRFHAATVHQKLQAGIIPRLFVPLAPDEILHSWVEVALDGRWVRLEGVILDEPYLAGLRNHLGISDGPLLGFAVGTNDLGAPEVAWCGLDTEIQMTGVARDFGTRADPDEWYAAEGTNLGGVRGLVYRHLVRHLMNRRVRRLRTAS